MSNIAYINGVYANMHDAKINIEDRGLQFADSVYEVIGVNNGKLLDWDLHYRRLERSLSEIQIFFSHTFSSLSILLEELVRKKIRAKAKHFEKLGSLQKPFESY